jgi:hypothetical protein
MSATDQHPLADLAERFEREQRKLADMIEHLVNLDPDELREQAKKDIAERAEKDKVDREAAWAKRLAKRCPGHTRRGEDCGAADCVNLPLRHPLNMLERRMSDALRSGEPVAKMDLDTFAQHLGRYYGYGSEWAAEDAPEPAVQIIEVVLDMCHHDRWDDALEIPQDRGHYQTWGKVTRDALACAGYAIVPVEVLP